MQERAVARGSPQTGLSRDYSLQVELFIDCGQPDAGILWGTSPDCIRHCAEAHRVLCPSYREVQLICSAAGPCTRVGTRPSSRSQNRQALLPALVTLC